MPNSPQTLFNETDLTHGVADVPVAINGVMVTTKRGPVGLNKEVVSSWPQFERTYGGLILGNVGVTQAKRALERGSALRVCRMIHYTDPSDPEAWDAAYSVMGIVHRITLDSALMAGHSIVATKGATVITQAFSVSSINTLNLFAQLLRAQSFVVDAIVIDGTHITVGTRDAVAVVFTTTGVGAPNITDVPASSINTANGPAFGFTPKAPGSDYDNVRVYVLPPSNGRTDSFNLEIRHKLDSSLTEKFTNLRIPGKPTVAQSDYLRAVADNSLLLNPVYYDLSAEPGLFVVPVYNQVLGFRGGTNGSPLVAADYIGDSAGKTGFSSFDGVEDIGAVAVLDNIVALVGVHEAGAAYASARKDLKYFFHLGEEGDTEQAIAADRNALNIDNSYARGFCGGIIHLNTLTSQQEWIPELGDVLGIAAYTEEHFGPWLSFAGKNRGEIFGAIGSGNNWGSRGNKVNLDILGQAQMNPVVDRDRKTYLLSNFTMAVDYSQLSFGEIRDLLIYLKKSIAPTLERYLEEPCEPTSWKKLYLEVQPFLDNLESQRAFQKDGWRWEGDQFARSVDQADLKVNNAADISLGKYKARLFIKAVVGMKEIEVNITITPSSISFEDALSLVQP